MTETRFFIGVDPGTMTGLVVWDNTFYEVITEHEGDLKSTFDAIQTILADMTYIGVKPVLLAERFDISMDTLRKSRDGVNDALDMLGILKGFSLGAELQLHKIARSDAKNFANDDALKRHNLWLKSRHTRDAVRVVVTYLAQYDPDFVRNYWAKVS